MANRGEVSRLVDNHYVNNPVFHLIEADGSAPLPAAAWDRVAEVREALAETIETLSPKDWSFIFTNYLVDVDEDHEWIARLETIAERRENRFVPVRLLCNLEELERRVLSPDRIGLKKLIDPEWLRQQQGALLDLEHPNLFSLDVTELEADEAAREILANTS